MSTDPISPRGADDPAPTPTPTGTDAAAGPGRPASPGRRRVAAVAAAAAVLLAGGGAAYWAAAGPGGGPAAGDGAAEPPPLALDGVAASRHSGAGGGSGVAAGEQAPRPVYRATGALPEGPRSAPVYRAGGAVPRARVAALAEALHVPGTPHRGDGRWVVGSPDGGPQLTVGGDGSGSRTDGRSAGTWSYTDHREAPGQAEPLATKGRPPVSADRAEHVVRPVLEALRLEGAALDASSVAASSRTVSAAPRVDGMPTQDWESTLTVGPDGRIERGHGSLGGLAKGARYPVMSAQETLKQLNERGTGTAAPRGGGIVNAAPGRGSTPGTDGEGATDGGQAAQGGPRRAVRVTGADFGLVTHYTRGRPVLVPSWIYTVDAAVSGGPVRVAHPAVQPRFLAPAPPASRRPGGGATPSGQHVSGGSGGDGGDRAGHGGTALQRADSYRADGRTLKVTFWGGACGGYRASAEESADAVAVRVEPADGGDPKQVCVKMAERRTVEVTLDRPLGDRGVVDARSGAKVPHAG